MQGEDSSLYHARLTSLGNQCTEQAHEIAIKQISRVISADNGPHWIISLTPDCIKTFCSEGIASKTWTDELSTN